MSLLERQSHFEFGENWKAYSRKIDQRRIDFAIEGMTKLVPEGLAGKTFLDIGCGSGLHSLAAHARRPLQWLLRRIYMAARLVRVSFRANPVSLRGYAKLRGMQFSHDAHNWLGGHPYEAAQADALIARIFTQGFTSLRTFPVPRTIGLLGTGCSEFVFERNEVELRDGHA